MCFPRCVLPRRPGQRRATGAPQRGRDKGHRSHPHPCLAPPFSCLSLSSEKDRRQQDKGPRAKGSAEGTGQKQGDGYESSHARSSLPLVLSFRPHASPHKGPAEASHRAPIETPRRMASPSPVWLPAWHHRGDTEARTHKGDTETKQRHHRGRTEAPHKEPTRTKKTTRQRGNKGKGTYSLPLPSPACLGEFVCVSLSLCISAVQDATGCSAWLGQKCLFKNERFASTKRTNSKTRAFRLDETHIFQHLRTKKWAPPAFPSLYIYIHTYIHIYIYIYI